MKLPKLSGWLKWLLIIPVLIAGFIISTIVSSQGPITEKERSEKFILINPLDLSQIKGFSKYRSCMGHDYRGPTVQTDEKESSPRSMKHYILVNDELKGKDNIVKAIAPFDGEISHIELKEPNSQPSDRQVWLTPDTHSNIKSPRQWHFVFMHIDMRDDLKEGSKIKAGEVIGTAKLARGEENSTNNFDMAVKFTRPMKEPEIDVPFAHFSDSVMAQYQKYGIKLADVEIPQQFRDQNPCPLTDKSWGGDVYFPPTTNPIDFVYLK